MADALPSTPPLGAWIVTRAEPGASQTVERLAAMGVQAIAAPALTIMDIPDVDLSPAGFAALAFTSAAGVSSYARRRPERSLPAYVVGSGTAAAARAAGFATVHSAAGDVAALIQLILQSRPGPILHVSGADQVGDLVGAVRAAGLIGKRRIAYSAEPVASLNPPAVEAMLAGRAAGAMFYSARGAQAFAAKWPETFVDHLTAMSALCLSAAVAEKAKALPWGRIAVAAAPSEEAILALIGAAAAET